MAAFLRCFCCLQRHMKQFNYPNVPRFPFYCRAKQYTLHFTNKHGQRIVVGFINLGESLEGAYIMYLLSTGDNEDAASVLDGAKVGSECGGDCVSCGCAPVYGCEPLHAHRWATGSPASARPAPG
jgi:hypothetical protein